MILLRLMPDAFIFDDYAIYFDAAALPPLDDAHAMLAYFTR